MSWPIPFVLLTIILVWWIAGRLGGQFSGCLAAVLYIFLSTDPYLFGNGSNLEHFVNLFSVASLAFLIHAWDRPGRWPLLAAGICLGAAALVKQFAIFPVVIVGPASAFPRGVKEEYRGGKECDAARRRHGIWSRRSVDRSRCGRDPGGSRRGPDAIDDIFFYGRGARDRYFARTEGRRRLSFAGSPEMPIRSAVYPGHSEPRTTSSGGEQRAGRSGWPRFHRFCICCSGRERAQAADFRPAGRSQPGLRWPSRAFTGSTTICCRSPVPPSPSRFALPTPSACAAGVCGTESGKNWRRIGLALLSIPLLASAIGLTAYLEVQSYLLIEPEDLTIRFKGGRQWVVLRNMGRDLGRRARIWKEPHLYIWGWQSPLHFYARMDSPTRHFFVDNLLRDQADRDHRLIRPRTDEIIATLERKPPELIFTGYPPFRALRAFLNDRYLPSKMAPGLWVRQEDFGRFERARAISGGN